MAILHLAIDTIVVHIVAYAVLLVTAIELRYLFPVWAVDVDCGPRTAVGRLRVSAFVGEREEGAHGVEVGDGMASRL